LPCFFVGRTYSTKGGRARPPSPNHMYKQINLLPSFRNSDFVNTWLGDIGYSRLSLGRRAYQGSVEILFLANYNITMLNIIE
jgi:hypothetical protein